ncbi:MAG: cytidylate kinase-like family protein [Lachnospiraceae bacterium]
MSHKIICISREFGSGGHIIGANIAKELGIGFYDKNLLEIAVKYGEIKSGALDRADEKATRPWFYKLLYEGNDRVEKEKPASETLFQLQRDVIKKIAQREDCVIAGRCCADTLQNEDVKMLSVYILAPTEYRIQRKMEQEQITEMQATVLVRRVDKERESYYNYYTHKEWGNPLNYDLCLNSERIGTAKIVEILKDCYEKM